MICSIIYPLGTLIHIQLSIQTYKSSQNCVIDRKKNKWAKISGREQVPEI